MINLNLDLLSNSSDLLTKNDSGKTTVWDPVRKIHVVFTPEESVRQLLYIFLTKEFNSLNNRISIEKELKVNFRKKRFDMLVYDSLFQPFMLVECKAPHVNITQSVFDQVAWYNVALKAPFLLVSNGRVNYCAQINFEEKSYSFLDKLPFDKENL